MSITGHIENGQVILDGPLAVPDGTPVIVSINTDADAADTPAGQATLYEKLRPFIGSLEGLPSDYAINHDHYLHGQPKRQ